MWNRAGEVLAAICARPFSLETFRRALERWESQYPEFGSLFRLMTADRMIARGEIEDARALVEDVHASPAWASVELRVKAELAMRENPDNRGEAEKQLREAIRIAKRQDAGLWEKQAEEALERWSRADSK
jgi:hypothetical protein